MMVVVVVVGEVAAPAQRGSAKTLVGSRRAGVQRIMVVLGVLVTLRGRTTAVAGEEGRITQAVTAPRD